jgi:very-short-patch-repair endonuclease
MLGREAWDLVQGQHGVVARRQLLEIGLSAGAIEHRLRRKRLHRVLPGVYAVGRPQLSVQGRRMAAVLACGPRAMLSHRSAGELWGVAREAEGRIEVSLPSTTLRRHTGIRIYRRTNYDRIEMGQRQGIPVTGLVQTLLDLATCLDQGEVERVIGDADKLALIDPEALRAALARYPGRRGVGRLREILDRRTFRLTDSELERRFLRLVHRARLKMPLTRQVVNGFRVDFYWPGLGLVVETDGLRYHRTTAQQARDRRRDQAHVAAGMASLRFTHAQVYFEGEYVVKTLLATSESLRVSAALTARRRSR